MSAHAVAARRVPKHRAHKTHAFLTLRAGFWLASFGLMFPAASCAAANAALIAVRNIFCAPFLALDLWYLPTQPAWDETQ